MEIRKLNEGDYVCFYCGKNIQDTDNKCDCPDALEYNRIYEEIGKNNSRVKKWISSI